MEFKEDVYMLWRRLLASSLSKKISQESTYIYFCKDKEGKTFLVDYVIYGYIISKNKACIKTCVYVGHQS